MSTEMERRAPGATRLPFEALVEVGGGLGPGFEATAINISEDGMKLRTAYLPEVGAPLTCRFDAGAGASVLAAGEVVWKQDSELGGEFGVRFTGLDDQSVEGLQRLLGVSGPPSTQPSGSRVRLHIDGLGQPMRARVKDMSGTAVTAFSELGFLQVGKHLDLEDTTTGDKRPARIHRVEVEIDSDTQVPQLVVSLRYDDELARTLEAEAQLKENTPEPSVIEDGGMSPVSVNDAVENVGDVMAIEQATGKVRGAWSRSAARVAPTFAKFAGRTKTTIALLMAKRKPQVEEESVPVRRTTAPPPGGGLRASGRKVIREELLTEPPVLLSPLEKNKKKIAIGGAVGLALVLSILAMRSPAPAPILASASGADQAAAIDPAVAPVAAPAVPATPAAAAIAAPTDPTVAIAPTVVAQPLPVQDAVLRDIPAKDSADAVAEKPVHKKLKVLPFANGTVVHGNMLRLKMDGMIEKIEGASQPTGFTVALPSRKSLEAAAPLASRDSRIASIRVTNEPNGAELSVAFKDGVPNYLVRAKGDYLEILLAPISESKETGKGQKDHGKGMKAQDHEDDSEPAHHSNGKHHKKTHAKRSDDKRP